MELEDPQVRLRVETCLSTKYGGVTDLTYLRSLKNHVYRASFPGGLSRVIKLPGNGIIQFPDIFPSS